MDLTRRLTGLLLTVALLWVSVPGGAALSATDGEQFDYAGYREVPLGVPVGEVTGDAMTGYTLAQSTTDWNSFGLFDIRCTAFILEATMTFTGGDQVGGLVFGAPSPEAAGGSWFGLHVQADNSVRIFDEANCWAGGLNVYGSATFDICQPIAIKLKVSAEGDVEAYIGDSKTPVTGHSDSYASGYVGFTACKSSATYTDVRLWVPEGADPLLYSESYRPQIHYTQTINWANDPNGLVYNATTGEYHLFYQYSPASINWRDISWGHAVSTDLVHWEEQGVALLPDELGLIFSGCAVIDYNNTSGLFPDTVPPSSRMVALFTHDGGDNTYGREKQSMAYSLDDGKTWIKYEGNPVIPNAGDQYGVDFRDPKVIWMEDDSKEKGGCWLMTVGGWPTRMFTSDNLIDWTYNSSLSYLDGSPINAECPDLYPLFVDDDPEKEVWVFSVAGHYYVLGDLQQGDDGLYRFVSQTERRPYNAGNKMYAMQSFYNDPQGRRICLFWMQDEHKILGKTWNGGGQSIPFINELKTIDGVVTLVQSPVEELETLRTPEPLLTVSNTAVSSDSDNLLEDVDGLALDLEATIAVGDAQSFGFTVRESDSGTQKTTIRYDVAAQQLVLDLSSSGEAITDVFRTNLKPNADGTVTLRILVDTTAIDVFGGDGAAVISSMMYPDATSRGLSFFTSGGSVTVQSLTVYGLRSFRTNQDNADQPARVDLLCSADEVEVGQTVTVKASVLPWSADDAWVEWTVDENLFTIVEETPSVLTLRALAAGETTIMAITCTGGLTASLDITAFVPTFESNVDDWYVSQGGWRQGQGGYVLPKDGYNSNSFLMNPTVGVAYVMDTTLTLDGGSAIGGVVFGSTTLDPQGDWLGVHVQQGTLRVFDEKTCWDGGLNAYISHQEDITQPLHLRLKVHTDGTLLVYLNDMYTPFAQVQSTRYTGGYAGLTTYDTPVTVASAYMTALGDVNEDGRVSVADVRTVLRAAVGKITLTGLSAVVGDVDDNGDITVSDVRRILRAAMGKTDL